MKVTETTPNWITIGTITYRRPSYTHHKPTRDYGRTPADRAMANPKPGPNNV